MVAWGVIAGLQCIFGDGTYVVFSTWLSGQSGGADEGAWWLVLFEWIGQSDKRFLDRSSYLVSNAGLLAALIGPLCLWFCE